MASVTYGELLRNKGIRAFLWTQFLGAFNDNVFKIIVSMAAWQRPPARRPPTSCRGRRRVHAPFLLFSGYAGQLSDRYSKRTVLVATKALEIVVHGSGLVALSMAADVSICFSSSCS